MKRTVSELINQKKLKEYSSVEPSCSILDALSVLERDQCGALLVMRHGELLGVFSERDFARAVLKKGLKYSDRVDSVMSRKIFYVEPSFTLEECLQVMSKIHVRHLPVLENGMPVAMLSMRQIMELLVDDKDAQIRELTSYINGPGSVIDFDQNKKVRSQAPIFISNVIQEAL